MSRPEKTHSTPPEKRDKRALPKKQKKEASEAQDPSRTAKPAKKKKARRSYPPVPPGHKRIFRPWITCKKTGRRIWAWERGIKAFPLDVPI